MESESRRVGWGRTVVSTFWHWFDERSETFGINPDQPLRSVCETIGSYKGHLIPEIERWESDPSICEICRDIRSSRAAGRISKSEPMRLVAIVPLGLPAQIRAFLEGLNNMDLTTPPFHVALMKFKDQGVTKPFLAALLHTDRTNAGKDSQIPRKFWETPIEEIREVEGVTRIRFEREPKTRRN